ncbi:transmembrane protease serine 11F-like [Chrysoperla carnea]|uniref:transmembrane protease serine 11F-like n=1 Tax=Chrysoperla carnea TaxID=189513 RepID=UPI001D07269A|nr:transmembrane protease serine 11F-like [Chrysoperla carnea]
MLRICILLITLAVPILGASIEGRVVGGVDADLGDVPSIVSLRSYGEHNCGGVLISKDYVLTAGHCAFSPKSIQYGVIEIEPSAEDETVISIAAIILHENYSSSTLENDIALLKVRKNSLFLIRRWILAEPAVFGKYVKPAVLPEKDEPAPGGSNVLLAGWGYTATGGFMPKRLQKANITIVDLEECRSIHQNGNGMIIYDSNICAGVPGGSKEQCNGDSGGPLTLDGKVVGLVSRSIKPCGTPPFPGAYTRVASFRDWIPVIEHAIIGRYTAYGSLTMFGKKIIILNIQNLIFDTSILVQLKKFSFQARYIIMLRFCILLITLVIPILGASLENRVIGGEDANLGDVPSIVSLRRDSGDQNCGGVLISKDYVLTAAHCAPSAESIQYGVLDIDSNADDETVIAVAAKIVNKKYDSWTLENDIALLKLAEPAVFGKYVQPAILPDTDDPVPAGSNVLLAGWGVNSSLSGYSPTRLQKANLTVVDLEECKSIHLGGGNSGMTVVDSMLCAGSPGGEKEQCNGDSGGPLTFNGKIVGLVSWSIKPCGLTPYPGVYTRVASFRKWIRTNSGV